MESTERIEKLQPKPSRSDLLKIIAMITMLIDHVGVLLFPELRLLRTVGRIAFPIFAWMLVQGFIYTSSRRNYAFRLLFFALVSEFPYSFLNKDMVYEPWHFNVMYLLLLGLGVLGLAEKSERYFGDRKWVGGCLISGILIAVVAMPDVIEYYNPEFMFSYSTYGLLMILIFYLTREKPILTVVFYVLLSFIEPYRVGAYYRAIYYEPEMTYWEAIGSPRIILEQIILYKNGLATLEGYFFQVRSVMGLILILFLKKVKVSIRLPKYVGYGFYPAHMAVLILVRLVIDNL